MKSASYRRLIASENCLVCGSPYTQAHHLLRAAPRGMAKKTGDEWCVPLCDGHHKQLHANGNEIAFFELFGLNYDRDVKGWAIKFYRENKPKERSTVQRKTTKRFVFMKVPIELQSKVQSLINKYLEV